MVLGDRQEQTGMMRNVTESNQLNFPGGLAPHLPVRPDLRHYPISVAPMMDRTDRHFRYLMRLISQHTLLYTEMVTVPALLHGDLEKLMGFDAQENPLVLQVGGDDPKTLATCARLAEDWGYAEINLNVGCPSSRVQDGHFGACLMGQPERVADCVAAMQAATSIPVTVKHRIGIDDRDRYEDLANFVEIVASAGCRHFTVHARKAWLQGLSPKENRTVPPLRYADVYRLKQEFPQLWIEINGGFTDLATCQAQLDHVDAVMIGRAAYDDPYLFAGVDQQFYGSDRPPLTRHQVVEAMLPYIDRWIAAGGRLHSITRHMLNLFKGQAGSRAWKRQITENACLPGAGSDVVKTAIAQVPCLTATEPWASA